MKGVVLVCLVTLGVASCGQYSIQNIDKPAPRSDEGWLRSDGTPLHWREAGKALLECGDPSIDMTGFVYKQALGITDLDETLKHAFMVNGCMEQSGLRRRWGSLKESCSYYPHYASFPACQPGSVFPKRSVERRLNSWYCRIKTDREYCRRHAFTPSACDDPKKDYNNPPLECRP